MAERRIRVDIRDLIVGRRSKTPGGQLRGRIP